MSHYHTPGPWKVKRDTYQVVASDGLQVAYMSTQRADDVAAANARLIAAAPDMLSLLRRSAESLQCYCAETHGDMNDSLASEIEVLLMKVQP